MGITHATVATGTDSGTGEIHKAQWNADHVITGENFGFIGAKVYNSTTQSIPDNSETAATFDTEEWDTDGFHSVSSNTSRLTIPAGLGGKYLLTGGGFWNSNPVSPHAGFKKNGNTWIRSSGASGRAASSYSETTVVVADLVAGDYVEFLVYQNSGGAVTFGHASAVDAQASFSAIKLDSGHVGQGVGARVYQTGATNPGGSYAALAFGAESFDTDGFHDNSTNNERLTIPTGLGGKYLIAGAVYSSGANGYLAIRRDGTTYLGGYQKWSDAGQFTCVADLAAGQYIEAMSNHSGNTSGTNDTWFSIMRLDAMPTPVGVLRNTVISPSSDTYIDKQAATTNYDSGTTMIVGNKWGTSDYTRFGLLTFDTAALAGRTVNSAFLQLVRTDGSALPVTFLQARRILRAYSPTQVTWNEYSTGNNWTTAGAESTGNDVAAGAYGDHQLQNTPGYATNFIRLDVTSLLQEDIDASSTTLRVILGMTNADGSINTITLASVNNATVAYRPKLFVAYA